MRARDRLARASRTATARRRSRDASRGAGRVGDQKGWSSTSGGGLAVAGGVAAGGFAAEAVAGLDAVGGEGRRTDVAVGEMDVAEPERGPGGRGTRIVPAAATPLVVGASAVDAVAVGVAVAVAVGVAGGGGAASIVT